MNERRTTTVELIGRDDAVGVLEALLDGVGSAGGARCAVVSAPAGGGKTALVSTFADRVDADALVITADIAEQSLDYAVADQLLRAAGDARPDLVGRPDGPPEVAAVGLRLLDSWGERQRRERPAVVVIDDAHWADAASLRALSFALRRVAEETVVVVLAVRDDLEERLPAGFARFPAARRVALRGLDANEVRELARRRGVALSLAGARRLREHAGGMPLYLHTLLDELPVSAWEGGAALPPAPELFARQVGGRLEGIAPASRALVEAAAVLGTRADLALVARVARLDAPLVALEEVERAGVLSLAPGARTVAFDHPLTRAAVYHGMVAARRASLHVAVADAVDDRGVALLHRAAAALGEDPALAAELERFADEQVRRGALASAAECLAAAVPLVTPDDRDRVELAAVDALLSAGQLPAARARLAAREDAGDSARLACVRGHLALLEARAEDAERELRQAWDAADADRDLRRTAAQRLATVAVGRLQPEEAGRWARRGAELLDVEERGGVAARWPEVHGLATGGDYRGALALLEQIAGEQTPTGQSTVIRALRGWLRLLDDDVAGSRAELRAVVKAEHRLGAEGILGPTHVWLARAELAAGAWDQAHAHAETAQAIADVGEASYVRVEARLACFTVAAMRGDPEVARRQLAVAAEGALMDSELVRLVAARATLAAIDGRPTEVLAALELLDARGLREAASRRADLRIPVLAADALTRLGRLDAADAALRPFEARAAERGLRSFGAALARVRGRLDAGRGDPASAEAAFTRDRDLGGVADALRDRAGRARTGGAAASTRATAPGCGLLESARDCFVRLGARPALAHCERSLASSGLRRAQPGDTCSRPDRARAGGRGARRSRPEEPRDRG